jgi:hypothetical protein
MTYIQKEVARSGEQTRVLSSSFIFSFSPLYRWATAAPQHMTYICNKCSDGYGHLHMLIGVHLCLIYVLSRCMRDTYILKQDPILRSWVIYNATSRLVRFENKSILFCFERHSRLLQHCRLRRFVNKNILFCFEKHSSLQQRWRCT